MALEAACLTIAGVDSSGGAGILMDTAMMRRVGVHPAAVITATTAQNSTGVHDVHVLPSRHIEAQMEAVFSDLDVRAAKTGMLPDGSTIRTVARILKTQEGLPVVVDPVMVATSGSALTVEDPVDAFLTALFPVAALVTPNIPEAECLLGPDLSRVEGPSAMALALEEKIGTPVLLKGGHGDDNEVIDCLASGGEIRTFTSRRRKGTFHGTGCALSATIAAHLARGVDLPTAVDASRTLLLQALDNAYLAGTGKLHYLSQV